MKKILRLYILPLGCLAETASLNYFDPSSLTSHPLPLIQFHDLITLNIFLTHRYHPLFTALLGVDSGIDLRLGCPWKC